MIKILFVCTGNICRSPTAEVVLRQLARSAGTGPSIHVESAGTHAYHVGEPADGRAIALVERKTPTRGREVGIIEQLFGNLARGGLPTDEQ